MLVKVGEEVEIARVRTTGCPKSCPGPQMEEVRVRWGIRFRLIPCPHTGGIWCLSADGTY